MSTPSANGKNGPSPETQKPPRVRGVSRRGFLTAAAAATAGGDPLHDPEWPEGQAPHEIGRQQFGRIAIASADAGGSALIDVAIDQAHRAVGELVQSKPD